MRLGRQAQAGELGDLSAVWFASGVSAEMKPPTLDRKALAVPEGFQLPWNTTRTMADVWAAKASETAEQRRLDAKAREAARQRQYLADYQRRQNNAGPVMVAGKVAYAGYDGDEA